MGHPSSSPQRAGRGSEQGRAVSPRSELGPLKRRAAELRPGEEGELLETLGAELERVRRPPAGEAPDEATEYQLLWLLLPLARRAGVLARFRGEIDRALALAGERRDELLALTNLRADVEEQDGDFQRAEATVRGCLARAGELATEQKAVLLLRLARLLTRQDRPDPARELLDGVLPALEAGDHPQLAARARFHLGNLALRTHRLEEAEREHRRALDARRQLGDVRGVCASTSALGAVSLAAGDYPQALTWYRASEGEARRHDEAAELAWALLGLGRTLTRLGDYAAASGQLRAVLEIRRGNGDEEGQAMAALALAENELYLGRLDAASEQAQQTLFRLTLSGTRAARGDGEQLLGRVLLARRHQRDARRHLEAALELHGEENDAAGMAFDRSWLLAAMLRWPVGEEIEPLVEAIEAFLDSHPYPDQGEGLDLRSYQALTALHAAGSHSPRVAGRRHHLERAYASLMRKTAYLDAPLRHRFLFQVVEHDALLRAAAEHGIATPLQG